MPLQTTRRSGVEWLRARATRVKPTAVSEFCCRELDTSFCFLLVSPQQQNMQRRLFAFSFGFSLLFIIHISPGSSISFLWPGFLFLRTREHKQTLCGNIADKIKGPVQYLYYLYRQKVQIISWNENGMEKFWPVAPTQQRFLLVIFWSWTALTVVSYPSLSYCSHLQPVLLLHLPPLFGQVGTFENWHLL